METRSTQPFRLPAFAEIPDVGLYLEQTVKYLNGYLAPLGDSPVTPSMVSNYVKMKLIPSPQRKQYDREQIASLFFIAVSKGAASLEHVRMLLTVQRGKYPIRDAYETFRAALEQAVQTGPSPDSMPGAADNMATEIVILHHIVAIAANQAFLNRCFAALAAESGTDEK